MHAEIVGDGRFLAGDAGPQSKAGPAVGNDVGLLRRRAWSGSGRAKAQLEGAGHHSQYGHHGECQAEQAADHGAHGRFRRRSSPREDG